MFSLAGKRVWVAGHRGMVGSALLRRLASTGAEVLTVEKAVCDLRNQAAVQAWIAQRRPDVIFIAAAVVGGIEANQARPADFLYDNLVLAANIIHAAAKHEVSKLMMLGSSCFYPRQAEQPIREEALLGGPLESTNEWYAVAKIASVKLCQAYRRQQGKDFIAVVPTNLYGPGDNFDLAGSHVIPAVIRRIHEAKTSHAGPVELWGTGAPRREFLYVDDAADALVHLMQNYSEEAIINVAGGEDISIKELASLVADVVGYTGGFRFDTSKPDGMPRKVLDASRIRGMGWRPRVSLRDGLKRTYEWFVGQSTFAGGRMGRW